MNFRKLLFFLPIDISNVGEPKMAPSFYSSSDIYWCEKCKKEVDEETIYVEEENKYICKKCCKRFKYDYILNEEDEQ